MFQVYVIAFSLLLNPGPVLIDVGSIDDEEETLVGHLIHQEVVNDATILVAHHAIEDFSMGHACHIVRKDVIDIAFCVSTGNQHFAHVTDIEHATGCAYCLMLVHNARILNRHVEAAKGRHQRSQGDVFVIETGLFVVHKGFFIGLFCE